MSRRRLADAPAPAAPVGQPVLLGSRRATIALAVACLLMVGFAVYAVHVATKKTTGTFPITPVPTALPRGSTAPSFDIPHLGGGGTVSLTEAAGRPVVINFFASWCSDCRAELSAFATASRHAGAKVAFVGVDTFDSAPGTAESLLRHAGDAYPVGTDHSGAVAARYRIPNGLPVTYFLDSAHQVVGEALGQQTASDLEHWVALIERPRRR